ncbi:hypothetical protein F5Y05DRAFT_10318 [Hypoxylon sp. FL0543]|nr:hypothetical protein F5Y05DRAFT_10318 [Hypoxylon sp. FL0543]
MGPTVLFLFAVPASLNGSPHIVPIQSASCLHFKPCCWPTYNAEVTQIVPESSTHIARDVIRTPVIAMLQLESQDPPKQSSCTTVSAN